MHSVIWWKVFSVSPSACLATSAMEAHNVVRWIRRTVTTDHLFGPGGRRVLWTAFWIHLDGLLLVPSFHGHLANNSEAFREIQPCRGLFLPPTCHPSENRKIDKCPLSIESNDFYTELTFRIEVRRTLPPPWEGRCVGLIAYQQCIARHRLLSFTGV